MKIKRIKPSTYNTFDFNCENGKKVEKKLNKCLTFKLLQNLSLSQQYFMYREDKVMSLGEKLRNLRLKTKKTLSEQSKILKVSMNSVYRWEHDLAMPRKGILRTMADYYGVPLDWLLSENASASLVSEAEQSLLGMFRKLPDNSRYKVLGYVERMYVEEYGAEVHY